VKGEIASVKAQVEAGTFPSAVTTALTAVEAALVTLEATPSFANYKAVKTAFRSLNDAITAANASP